MLSPSARASLAQVSRPSVPAMPSPPIHGTLLVNAASERLQFSVSDGIFSWARAMTRRRPRMESKITAARQIDQLRAHQLDTLGAGALEAVHGLEHERNDGRESKHDQSGADAEDRLMTP